MADMYYYNGVLLPEITVNLLAGHSYCWIRENKSSGYYDLALSDYPFKFVKSSDGRTSMNEQTDYATKKAWYRVAMSDADSATEWEDNTEAYTFSAWTLDSDRTCIWSNHDIPNEATPSTTVYFPAMKAYRAVDVLTPDTVAISKERLKGFAEQARRLGKVGGELTPGQIEEVLRGVTVSAALPSIHPLLIAVDVKPTILPKFAVNDINIVVDASPDVFAKAEDTTPPPAPKYSYNGVVLPEIPADVLADYPYAWIRKDTNVGYYELFLATGKWYKWVNENGSIVFGHEDSNDIKWYRIVLASAESAGAWVYYQDYSANNFGALTESRSAVWSNHNIPDGSADATEIYFEGSEPVLAE